MCPGCGTWWCASCGFKRSNASRYGEQRCSKCGGTAGKMTPVIHHSRAKREDHALFAAETDLTPTYPLEKTT